MQKIKFPKIKEKNYPERCFKFRLSSHYFIFILRYFDEPGGIKKGSGQFQGGVNHKEQSDGTVIFYATDSKGIQRNWHFQFENTQEKSFWQQFAENPNYKRKYNDKCKIHVSFFFLWLGIFFLTPTKIVALTVNKTFFTVSLQIFIHFFDACTLLFQEFFELSKIEKIFKF